MPFKIGFGYTFNGYLYLTVPYLTKDMEENPDWYTHRYDGITMADIPSRTPKHLGIIKCNEFMVNNSEYIICYVSRTIGGAAKTLNYAKRKKLKIINVV